MPKTSRKSKKVNPCRRPATQADVRKAVRANTDETVSLTQAIFFTVLRDKEGYDDEHLRAFWEHVKNLSDEIIEGRVSLTDLRYVLREEAGIYI